MSSIILVGPRAVGKTSIGSLLANELGYSFVDADDLFVAKHGKSIKDFVKEHGGIPKGWEVFRRYEAAVIKGICEEYDGQDIILAPGGGAVAHDQGYVYRDRNAGRLKEFGKMVYLLPSLDLEKTARILAERVRRDPKSAEQRPPLGEDDNEVKAKEEREFTAMFKTVRYRHPFYDAAAHEMVLTKGKTDEQVAEDIYAFL